MNPLEQYNSRNSSAFTIPDGGVRPVFVGGDYFYIETLSGVVTLSVNGGPFVPCQVGLIHSGEVGLSHIGKLDFKNESGVAVSMVVIYGKGKMEITGQVSIVNPTFGLAAADLLAITPAAVARVPDFDIITGLQTFTDTNQLSITNIGGADITVNGKTLPPGVGVNWSNIAGADYFVPVAVDATGSTALITYCT